MSAVTAAIAAAFPMPWDVEITFRAEAGQEVLTWHAPVKVTAPGQVVSVTVDLGSLEVER